MGMIKSYYHDILTQEEDMTPNSPEYRQAMEELLEPFEYTQWRGRNLSKESSNTDHATAPKLRIDVQFRNVYGEEKIYPVCTQAHTFARLLGQRTFTKINIAIIKQLGYEIVAARQEVKL